METGGFLRNFNWRMLLMRILVTMLALLFTALVVPEIMFISPNLVDWFLIAVVLGLLTAFIKPIIQFLTLRFIFAAGGLVVVVINTVLLYLLAWLMPDKFAVSGLLWTAVGGLVLGISSTVLEYLFGLTPPIVSEKYPEIRQRVKDRQFYRMQNELTRINVTSKGSEGQLAVAKVLVRESSPAMAQLLSKDEKEALQEQSDFEMPDGQLLALSDVEMQSQAAGTQDLESADAQPVENAAAPDLMEENRPTASDVLEAGRRPRE
jgi:putative membrane protein